jgi:indoleamine 2,3-dioxygenase
MYDKCNPDIFYHQIRPFLAGSKNMTAAGLPRGVYYPDGRGGGEWMQLRGGSNGQSSLIQLFDVVLGVDHAGNDREKAVSFHQEVRDYMPGQHRRFLEHISRLGSIRRLAETISANIGTMTEEEARFCAAFREATRILAEFRNKHLQMVTRYIVIPSRQSSGQQNQMRHPHDAGRHDVVNLASVSSRTQAGKAASQLTGTGGTALLPFLKQSRDETYEAGTLIRR